LAQVSKLKFKQLSEEYIMFSSLARGCSGNLASARCDRRWPMQSNSGEKVPLASDFWDVGTADKKESLSFNEQGCFICLLFVITMGRWVVLLCIALLFIAGPLSAVVSLCADHLPELYRRSLGGVFGMRSTLNAEFCSLERSRYATSVDFERPFFRTKHVSCFDWSRPGCTSGNFTVGLVGATDKGPDDPDAPKVSSYRFVADAVRSSPYFVSDPRDACVLMPAFEHANGGTELLQGDHALRATQRIHGLESWQAGGGRNFLLFDFKDQFAAEFDTGYAMVSKVGWSTRFYRPHFDIAFSLPPSFDPQRLLQNWDRWKGDLGRTPRFFATFKGSFTSEVRQALTDLHAPEQGVVVTHKSVKAYDYGELLLDTQFALCPRGNGLASYRLAEAALAGAIPVIIADDQVLPFEELLDWRSLAVVIPEARVRDIPDILRSIPAPTVRRMRCRLYTTALPLLRSLESEVSSVLELLRMNIRGVHGGKDTNSSGGALARSFVHADPRDGEECKGLLGA